MVAQLEQAIHGKLDTDKNGQLSLAEFKAAAPCQGRAPTRPRRCSRFDANKDGKVSATEFRAPALATFDRVDANKDGIVTRDEARKSATQR